MMDGSNIIGWLDRVIVDDCVHVLESIPERSIDLVFADPPYCLQLERTLDRPTASRFDSVTEPWDQFESMEAFDAFTRSWLSACRRVMKPDASIWVMGSYHSIHRVGCLMQDAGFWLLNDIAWIKPNPTPNFRGTRFTNAHETLIWAARSKESKVTFHYHMMKAMNDDLQMRSDWWIPLCSGRERLRRNGQRLHPTQKPEALLYRVLTASSRPGDVVLDPFLGSGTTAAVARLLNRRYIGIERSAEYAAIAAERIDAVTPAPPDWVPPEQFAPRRQAPRVSFGALLEHGLLRPGDPLYFHGNRKRQVRVRADGLVETDREPMSIHAAARYMAGVASCNGWILWYYETERGALCPIDVLRDHLRSVMQEVHDDDDTQ